ncbi:MAG TPA: tRNA (guanine(26)-N(2))-dimethyltransferase [Methanomassiliicoccales archaeon]|nr:tRNA (guanine(26)-N(2))-dimethyltransferase [Methanomassiliicoccales archaeon]
MPLADSVEVREGSTRLLVPRAHSQKGPGKRVGTVFFNSQMGFNRDVSVMLVRAIAEDGQKFLDAMAATGARGVRVANEAGRKLTVVLNDKDARALDFMNANIELNNLNDCTAVNQDLRCHLASSVYDWIDLDPFGSPVYFVQAALQGLKRNGVLAITATDTAPLAGTHAKKCMRRYMARPLRSPIGHEVGLRILIGYTAREAAQLDMGVHPLLCFYADHYFRCFLRVRTTAAAADASLSQLGYLDYDAETHERAFSFASGRYGPMWGGPIADDDVLTRMEATAGLQHTARCQKYLDWWRQEVKVPFFYENNEVASLLKLSPPVLDRIVSELAQYGKASRTHYSPTGFRTDLPFEEVLRIYRSLA